MKSLVLVVFAVLLMACGDQASDAMDAAKSTTSDAMDAAKSTTSDAMDAAKSTTSDAMDAAKSTASDAMDAAKSTASDAMGAAKDAVSMPGEEVTATIDAVKSAGGDITALPAEAAVGNINTWINKLSGMEGTEDVVAGLGNLKTELTSGDIDGSKVSVILADLAGKTRELGNGNPALNTIAGALEAGAKKLGGE